MDNANKKEPSHITLSREVAEKLISGFGASEQREFLENIGKIIEEDYLSKIDQASEKLSYIKSSLDNYKGQTSKLQDKQ